jgi:hypothetical protein
MHVAILLSTTLDAYECNAKNASAAIARQAQKYPLAVHRIHGSWTMGKMLFTGRVA